MLKVSAKWVGAFLICLLLGGVGGFWLGVQAAPVTSWSIVGDTLNIGKINANTVRDDDIAAGRIVYGGTAGLLSDDAGLTYDAATDTLTVGNLTVGGVPFNAESEASFVVWVDAGLYYAKNGHTGAVTSNAAANTIIQGCLNAVARGIVFLKAGTYPINTALALSSYQILRGEGIQSTFIQQTNPANRAISVDAQEYVGIEDLSTIGGVRGIRWTTVVNSWIKNVRSINATGANIELVTCYGIQLNNVIGQASSAGSGIVLTGCNEVTMILVCGLTNTVHGIQLFDCEQVEMINCDGSYNTGYGLSAHGLVASKISGYFEQNLGGDDVYIAGGTTFTTSQNIEIGPLWVDGTGVTGDTGLEITATTGVDIKPSCRFQQLSTDIAITSTVKKIDLRIISSGWNIYWADITQNTFLPEVKSGTATLLDGQNHVHVTHGLSYTPTAVDIGITFTEIPTNASTGWYVGDITATEFQLHQNDPGASNLDFSWSARRTP